MKKGSTMSEEQGCRKEDISRQHEIQWQIIFCHFEKNFILKSLKPFDASPPATAK
jgi:hypothetical protein